MTGTEFQEAKRIFGDALEVPPAVREAFVERACCGNDRVLGEVRSLLAAQAEVTRFLLRSAAPDGVVATLGAARASDPATTESGVFVVGPPREPAPSTDSVVAGRYELGVRLGAGAFGAVYRAHDRLSQQAVAVKVLPLAGGTGFKMLRREVAILRRAKLPGIVEMIDDGIDGAHAFIVMRLVEGEPFPRGGGVSWPALRHRALSLLEALTRLHWLGVLHRDLKPENVLVSQDGRVTIVDLGVAWEGELEPCHGSGAYVAGTPAYLAPECLGGAAATVGSDLYAVGVMLFEALTGRALHPARTLRELVAARCAIPAPRLAAWVTEVPRHVSDAVDAMLSLDPSSRPASASHAFALLGGGSPHESPIGRLPRLGGAVPVDAVVNAARAFRSIEVVGPPGSGRTRCLEDAADALTADGYCIRWTVRGCAPLESLLPVLGERPRAASNLHDAEQWAAERLAAKLRSHVIVFADDFDEVDRFSAAVLAAQVGGGCVVRVRRGAFGDGVVLREFSPEELRPLFHGPDRIHHLREDAAKHLHRRSGGLARRIVSELSAWVRGGLARREREFVVIDRAALDRLASGLFAVRAREAVALPADAPAEQRELLRSFDVAPVGLTPSLLARLTGLPQWDVETRIEECVCRGWLRRRSDGALESLVFELRDPSPAAERALWALRAHGVIADSMAVGSESRLLHLLAADRTEETLDEACAVARSLLREGHPERALAVASEALSGLRGHQASDMPGSDSVVEVLVRAALSLFSSRAMDHSLYVLARTKGASRTCATAETLLKAALLALSGDCTRSHALLDRPISIGSGELERCRLSIRAFAARHAAIPEERQAVAELARWARRTKGPGPRALYADCLAWLRYREHRFAGAARLHRRVAKSSDSASARASAWLNAASSSLEAFDLDGAEAAAQSARSAVVECRIPSLELRLEWVLRAVGYRRRTVQVPDIELVETARGVGAPNLTALVALNEAAVAWRTGRIETARALASEASRCFETSGRRWQAIVPRSLALACGASSDATSVERLVADVRDCPLLGHAVQAAALLANLFPAYVSVWLAAGRRLSSDSPKCETPREVVSEAEAILMIERAASAA